MKGHVPALEEDTEVGDADEAEVPPGEDAGVDGGALGLGGVVAHPRERHGGDGAGGQADQDGAHNEQRRDLRKAKETETKRAGQEAQRDDGRAADAVGQTAGGNRHEHARHKVTRVEESEVRRAEDHGGMLVEDGEHDAVGAEGDGEDGRREPVRWAFEEAESDRPPVVHEAAAHIRDEKGGDHRQDAHNRRDLEDAQIALRPRRDRAGQDGAQGDASLHKEVHDAGGGAVAFAPGGVEHLDAAGRPDQGRAHADEGRAEEVDGVGPAQGKRDGQAQIAERAENDGPALFDEADQVAREEARDAEDQVQDADDGGGLQGRHAEGLPQIRHDEGLYGPDAEEDEEEGHGDGELHAEGREFTAATRRRERMKT